MNLPFEGRRPGQSGVHEVAFLGRLCAPTCARHVSWRSSLTVLASRAVAGVPAPWAYGVKSRKDGLALVPEAKVSIFAPVVGS
jgi:hypothetical protein